MEALVTFFNTFNPSGASTQGQFNGGVSEIVVSGKWMKFQIWVNYSLNNILLAVLVLNCVKLLLFMTKNIVAVVITVTKPNKFLLAMTWLHYL